MKTPNWFAAMLCAPAMALGAVTAPPSAQELHVARCVAALEVNTDRLAEQVKGGREDLRPLLAQRLRSGVAFIARSYLDGERDEERSQALLHSALAAQKTLSEPELAARQAACADEGNTLLAKSNAFSRAVVSGLAERRMKKLLGP